jgi:hypothetical protein
LLTWTNMATFKFGGVGGREITHVKKYNMKVFVSSGLSGTAKLLSLWVDFVVLLKMGKACELNAST